MYLNSLSIGMRYLCSMAEIEYFSITYSLLIFCFKAPTAPPVDVRVAAINSSSISVDWRKPNKSTLHGMLRKYEIEYRRIECNEFDPVSVPSNATWTQVIVSNASSSKVISGLVYWSCYELRMRAVTIGNGPYSDVQQVRTKENGKFLIVDAWLESVLLIRQYVDSVMDIVRRSPIHRLDCWV